MGRATTARRLLPALLWCVLFASPVVAQWHELAPGLEVARFETDRSDGLQRARVTILRIDPGEWDFRLLSISELGEEEGRDVRRWCEDFGLVAAINAGMYHPDRNGHVGYMRSGEHVNQWVINKYQSVAAFDPRRLELPPYAIFDLDVTSLDSINVRYDCVVQNLRLIKGERLNRWAPSDRKWSEAALGEDAQGRMLLIACPDRLAMYDLIEILLSLPLDLVRAQHLEGRASAQMHVRLEALVDGDEAKEARKLLKDLRGFTGEKIPNVIGVVPREAGAQTR